MPIMKKNVTILENRIGKAYEFAKGRPDNEISSRAMGNILLMKKETCLEDF